MGKFTRDSRGRNVVSDELLLRTELQNLMPFDVVFYRMTEKDPYLRLSGVTVGPLEVHCKAMGSCILPTSYYVPRAFDRGRAGKWEHEIKDVAMNFVRNYGDMIGKGNRLPSRPEEKR